jgi:transcriptional regulator with XRE-family HTH domain
MSDFGAFVKETRERQGLSLREFCRLANLDPGNWSKVERGIFPPPKDRQCVSDIAGVLLLEQGSDDWNRLFELAAVGHIPAGLLAEPSVVERFSVFFRLNRSVPRLSRGQESWNRISADEVKIPKPRPKPGTVRSSRGGREKKK